MNKPEYIVIHHSLTKDGDVNDWASIRRFHMEENGWNDIGYHYGIEEWKGTTAIMVGRSESSVGAHAKEAGMNSRSIGICVVGNYDLEPPKLEKVNLLANLCQRIMRDYDIPITKVIGHRDVGLMDGFDWEKGQYKTCPGKLFPLDGLRTFITLMQEVGV